MASRSCEVSETSMAPPVATSCVESVLFAKQVTIHYTQHLRQDLHKCCLATLTFPMPEYYSRAVTCGQVHSPHTSLPCEG